jgi:hypothetical protein
VLDDLDLVKQLKRTCKKKTYADNPVCRVINTVPSLPGLSDLGGLLGTTGLSRALASGAPSPAPDPDALYGGLP